MKQHKKLALVLTIVALATGVLGVGTYQVINQPLSAQENSAPWNLGFSPEQQIGNIADLEESWVIGPFNALVMEGDTWAEISQEGDCTIYRSQPTLSDHADITAIQADKDLTRIYEGSGARVKVCGFIVHMPPASSGRPLPTTQDR